MSRPRGTPPEGLRILVVDDNAMFLATVADYLRRATRAEAIDCAECGAEALGLAATRSPQLVLMDLAMPDMNGIECARRMRARGFRRPIVIVTAQECSAHAAEAAAAGVDAVVSKWRFVPGIRPWITQVGMGA
jgi:CheY-like chemotaxis protein